MRALFLSAVLIASLPASATLSIAAAPESAPHVATGGELLKTCMNGTDYCSGFIAGISRIMKTNPAFSSSYCPDRTTTDTQIAAAVTDFFTRNPDMRDMEASALVVIALEDTYPCPK